eukprot:1793588-Amphidinium_carterae.1
MSAVTIFSITINSFGGALPGSGLQMMRAMIALYASLNRFAGTLPNRAAARFRHFGVYHNDFEGKLSQTQCGPHLCQDSRVQSTVPSRRFEAMVAGLLTSTGAIPSSLHAHMVSLGHNLLGGPIPQRLLEGSEHASKIVVAKALECRTSQQGQHATIELETMCVCLLLTKATSLLLKGAIPESASRLTMADITISLGHGLRGLLPSISGTVGLVSVWENGLEGHLRGAA